MIIEGNLTIQKDTTIKGNLIVEGNINDVNIQDISTNKKSITDLETNIQSHSDKITAAENNITDLQTKTTTLEENIHTKNTNTGTTHDIFVLDSDDSSLTDIKLQFGKTLAKVFKWTKEFTRFELGDSLFVFGNIANSGNTILGDDENDTASVNGNFNVSGNASITGTINGVMVEDITDMKKNITTNKDNLSNFQTSLTSHSDKITAAENNITTNKDNITSFQTSLTSHSDKITAAENNITTNKDNITSFQTSLTSHSDKITAAENNITTNKDNIATLQTTTSTLENNIHTQNTDIGTSQDTFILDNDDSALTDIKIQFGKTLAKIFKWSKELTRFELGDSLFVFGNISNNGNTTLGDDISDTTSVNGNLNVSGNALITGTINNRNLTTDGNKLDNIETNATADQSSAEVSVTLESLTSTNVQDALSEIHTLASQQTTPPHYATFHWNNLPGTKDKNALLSQGIVMPFSGTISIITLSTDPNDSKADGTFVITKNDNGKYTKNKEMSTISQNNTGKGDLKNSTVNSNPTAKSAGLSFTSGDVLRTYHIENTRENASLLIKVEYE